MIIDSVEIIPYEISFAVPLKTSTRTIYDHNGFLIKITGNGFTGFGEAAPLPGFSPDTISDCHDCLLKFRDETGRNGYEQSFEDLVRNMDSSCQSSPAARFGIETAVVDLFSKTENKSFSYFLSPISFTSISINGLYRRGYKPPDGISITKIKVQPGDISKTIHLIQKLSHKLGSDHQYRLDVNGGWNIDEAFQNANLLYGLPIDYIEQPLPPDQLDELSHLSKDIKIPIAVDESLTSFNSAKEIIRKQAAGVFIIKPMVTGSFSEIRDIVNLAKANQIRCVFSSSLELEVGRMAIIHLAAVNHITEPCGLDTGYLFTKSPASLPEIRNGKIQIPDEIGLGISSSHLRELF